MSKFNKIFEAREAADKSSIDKDEPNSEGKLKTGNLRSPKSDKTQRAKKTEIKEETNGQSPLIGAQLPQNKKRGRPQAKRSDPNYLGFTTYIRRDTHLNAKIALLQEGKGRELSELVETLLTEWLTKKDN